MTGRPVLWCCLIEFSIPWWKTRECGRKRVFDSILAFLGHCPADWAAEAAGFLLCLPSDRHLQLTRCPPTVWLGSLCPSLSYGDEESLVFVHVSSLKAPTPFCLSLCVVTCHISLPTASPMLTGRAWAWATINIYLLSFTCLTRLAASLCQSGFCFSSES